MTERIQVLDAKVRAICPIHGLSPRGDGTVRIDFKDEATTQQRTDAQTLADNFDLRPRKPRTLLAIRADVNALTTAQKNAVWADITSGTPPKWSTDTGPNAASIGVLWLLGKSGTLPAADVLEGKILLVTYYVQDNPEYLVQPAFDPSINIPGDQLA